MKKYTSKAFITKWNDKKVWFYCFEINQHIVSDISPLFKSTKLFKGKNIWIDITIVPGTMTYKSNESNKNKLVQLWNYYVRGKF